MRNVDTYSMLRNGYMDENRFSLFKADNFHKEPNDEYMFHHDQDYCNLLKQYKKETFVDDPPLSTVNINVYNTKDNVNEQSNNVNDVSYVHDDMMFNASSLGLSNSDDEALDDYLNALAKNYDDIDRRIRNAERFVNQMDNSISGDGSLKNNYSSLHSYNNHDESKVKYVTELRVNIADTMRKNTGYKGPERMIGEDNYVHSKAFPSPKRLEKHSNSPSTKRRSSIPVTTTNNVGNNSRKLRNKHFYLNYKNEYKNLKDLTSDIEQEIFPPPESFLSSNEKVKLVMDKDVQTEDISKYVNGVYFQPVREHREVQTMPQDSVTRVTVDAGVGSDDHTFRETPTKAQSKHMCGHKIESLDSSFTSKSDHGHEALKSNSNSNEDYSHIRNNTVYRKDITSPNQEKKLKPNKPHSINVIESPVQGKAAIDSHNIDNIKTLENSTKRRGRKMVKTSEKFNSPRKSDCSKNASQEIQRLLENLGSHLKASVSFRESERKENKAHPFIEPDITSFWDNPLQSKDMIGAIKAPAKLLKPNETKKVKKTTNVINSELQAICRTIENKIKKDKQSQIQQSSESENDYKDHLYNNSGTLRSESVDTRPIIRNSLSHQNYGSIKKSTSNLNLSGDSKFPCNYKISKSFDLNPYDDIIKSHLSPIDRRLKSVAAKNGCTILVEGPISAFDPTLSQTFRNKIMYRCTIAGICKDNLDKCINYLKETFPNTFLKNNSRA